jgi:hypothetical protein
MFIKSTGNHQSKRMRRGELQRPKPEEHGGMPQHRHCSLGKYRKDKNPKYHEEQHEDVGGSLAAHPPKNRRKGT